MVQKFFHLFFASLTKHNIHSESAEGTRERVSEHKISISNKLYNNNIDNRDFCCQPLCRAGDVHFPFHSLQELVNWKKNNIILFKTSSLAPDDI